jgi:hypothetical protein
MIKKILGIILATAVLATSAYALEVGGVKLPDTLSAGSKNLVLNGAGIRTKFFIKVYVAGLYLAQKDSNAQAIVNGDDLMAVRLQVISGMVDSKKMEKATMEGFESATNGNIAPIKAKIDQFMGLTFKEKTDVNDYFDFINVPGKGVEVYKNGTFKGTIEGLAFKKALYGIWLGDKPVQADLKDQMLGKK